ncbi:PREDICTED: uncharacterized protein LOC109126843 [Camelina sativa]|uniref:Uncharacterized protein LOC109126843 n=1 Tax=Camelina sativa TaxID=90675 RepID=A0ABM1QHM1_CAMSA|nr:PREDICTED: uncharacterized protein LOC109126843 [Camelina sativa]
MAIGDFNEIKNNSEKRGGPPRPESTFSDFRKMLQVCDFHDLKHTWDPFSWVGKSFTNRVFRTDHIPVVTTISNDFSLRRGHFFFDSRLVNREGFSNAVNKGWTTRRAGQAMCLSNRLSECRRSISIWKKANRSNAQEEIGILKKLIDQAHSNGSSTHQIRDLRQKLSNAYHSEEEFWRIKSRKTWLSSGDYNTKYFFAIAKSHTARNKLYSILDDVRREHYGDNQIGKVAEF